MEYSHYQQAIFDAVERTGTNLVVNACPGSGKTTTLKHLCSRLPSDEETLYLAFNTAIVEEARRKLPSHVSVMTLNGLGHRAVCRQFPRVTLDDRKIHKIIQKTVPHLPQYADLLKAVALLKIIPTEGSFLDLMDTFGVDTYDEMEHDARRVLSLSDNDVSTIDFNDQLRFPVIYDLPLRMYDSVLVDEAQDLSMLQAQLIAKLEARYIFVGDRHQAIYGFRGAMTDSMASLAQQYHATELPLSISYRCPRAVVREAYAVFPEIEAAPGAKEGAVLTIATDQRLAQSYTASGLVLCRNNAPLLAFAYTLLRHGVACHVRGRDIGHGLVALLKKLGGSSVRRLGTALDDWRDVEIAHAHRQGRDAKIQSIEDRYASLMVFIDRCPLNAPVSRVTNEIDALFAASTGVCLSTIHKAKGLEAQRVFFLDPFLLPAPFARMPWQKEQEQNLRYVALTRAKDVLVYM